MILTLPAISGCGVRLTRLLTSFNTKKITSNCLFAGSLGLFLRFPDRSVSRIKRSAYIVIFLLKELGTSSSTQIVG
ncbi:hypothetical protein THIOM_005281 [Candidatus Thiomargarita nelsonii]|uniref:Uncharacterized protein n=1 Tax=Candidatus Thiomargarita nelsonii TaxID=1003181 RepID=A0A176RTM6_9GAMM|nr:hypothetical protein THIOM_005281 [Candidatus Thiomargarita nelsonii]